VHPLPCRSQSLEGNRGGSQYPSYFRARHVIHRVRPIRESDGAIRPQINDDLATTDEPVHMARQMVLRVHAKTDSAHA
jgi:hypothetical protein